MMCFKIIMYFESYPTKELIGLHVESSHGGKVLETLGTGETSVVVVMFSSVDHGLCGE